MELLDVLDENGIKTGEVKNRDEIHKQGLWHRAIIVALVNDDNKILIQKRAKTKEKFPGLWDLSVAGHVPAGEDSMQCASSEVMEEIGTMLPRGIQVQNFRFMTSFRHSIVINENFTENQFYDVFVYRDNIDINKIVVQKEEVEAVKYASAFEIKELQKEGLMHPRDAWIDIVYKYINRF